MAAKMRHPNKSAVREKNHAALRAIRRLAELDVEIIEISFASKRPFFLVCHCPGTHYFHADCIGQGQDQDGHFIKQRTHLSGCDVEWHKGDL